MKIKTIQFLIALLLAAPFTLIAQDISMEAPPELEVNGIIFSSSGGVKFPDGTIQTTAYLRNPAMESGLSALVIEFAPSSGIKGPAHGDGITDGLNVLSLSNGLSNSSTTHLGGGSGAGKSNFQDLSFSRLSDINSTRIRSFVADGRHIAYVEVFFLRMIDNRYVIDHKVRYEDCIINSFNVSSGGTETTESVGINYGSACYCSYERSEIGQELESASFGWNIAENTAISTCNCDSF